MKCQGVIDVYKFTELKDDNTLLPLKSVSLLTATAYLKFSNTSQTPGDAKNTNELQTTSS